MSTRRTTWLASYPKSGNTWVRAQLDSLMTGDAPDLNALDRSSTNDRLDPAFGVPAGDLDAAELAGILRLSWNQRDHGHAVTKTHHAWLPAADGYPLPWQPEGARTIYIVRDPRDVVISWAHHLRVDLDTAAAIMGDGQSGSSADQLFVEHLPPWSQHVCSWLDDCPLPLLVVRYEDMQAQPREELMRIVGHLGIDASPVAIDRAVTSSSFTHLATAEIVSGFREATAPGRTFFRQGRSGAWREDLPSAIQQRIEEDHGDVMQRLDYL